MNRKELESAKKFFLIVLSIDLAITVVVAISNLWVLGVLAEIQAQQREVTESLLSTMNFWDGFGKLAVLSFFAVGIVLVKWLNACYCFASESLGATGFKNTGWTVAGWIIPIFNLFKPYQIINEIYRAGSSTYRQSDDWKKESGFGLLLAWWIFYAVTHLIMTIISKQLLRDMWRNDLTLNKSIGMVELSTVVCAISIIISLLWFWVANLLTQRLLVRSRVSAASPPLQYAYPASTSVTPIVQQTPPAIAMPASTVPKVTMSADPTPTQPILSQASSPFDEDAVYEVVANEMDSGKLDKGLWTRLYAEHDGDERKIKVAYIKQRAEKLIAGDRSRQAEIQAANARDASRQAESERREKIIKERLAVKRVVINADKFETFGDLVSHAECRGFSTAKYWLGLTYMTGYVVGQDLAEARFWLKDAASEAHEQARKLVALLDSKPFEISTEILGDALRKSVKNADFFGVQVITSKFPELINKGDSNGYTALHFAANGSNIQMLKYLIANGADPHKKNLYGKTPYEISNGLMKEALML